MATGSTTTTHPLLACVEEVAAAVSKVVGPAAPDPDYLSVDDKADYLVALDREVTRLTALLARGLAGAADVAERDGARDPGSWLAAQRVTTPVTTRPAFKLGVKLRRRAATEVAYRDGTITTEHASAVVDSVDRLPAALGADLIGRIETTLVGYCAEHTPPEIRRLGARALEAAAPDEADAILERLLAAEEERARAKTRLSVRDQGDGTAKINGLIPSLSASILDAALDAYTNPHRACHDHDEGGVHEEVASTGDPEVDRLTPAEKRGRAFCDLIEHLPTTELPMSGGTPVAVGVTITEDKLRRDAGAALVDDGLLLSTGAVRRLLCVHGAYPLVLSGESTVLDHGRRKRLFTADQIRARRAVQTTCQTNGCTVPSRWCHAHHRAPWATGGKTDLADLVLLCPHHHQRIHHRSVTHTYDAGDQVRFRHHDRPPFHHRT